MNIFKRMRENAKNAWIVPICLVAGVIAIVMLINSDFEHIEDKNGPDDYSLVSISDVQIIDKTMGCMGPGWSKSFKHPNKVKFHSDKFTGVYEVLYANYIGDSDFDLVITDFVVTEGNMKMVVVHEDEIIAVIEPGEYNEIYIEGLSGYVSLRIAGESAAYSFFISEFDYERYEHD